MTTQVSHELAEVLSRPVAGGAAARLEVETVAQPQAAAAAAAGIAAETAASPWQPPLQAALLYVEGATRPQPPVAAAAFVVEVLRRDTAAADVRTSAIDAFGQSPWPDAPCGVFAFRHDWATPLVERLQWQSSVVRTASGVEVRSAQRFVPRRLMRYSLGHGSAHDALVVDWLADHLGALAWWPLPQYAVVLEQPVPAGAVAIDAQGIVPDGFLPAQHQPVLDRDGQSWEVGDGTVWRWPSRPSAGRC
ncbi:MULTISPECIES: hypothetical protein [Caldimonas]|uniref:hypothetical protein n=1 Tax=Caldimonas TaxID=196013 RepID=UPI000399F201|nr:hypothetical protein [Caldimonas manganoxidans]